MTSAPRSAPLFAAHAAALAGSPLFRGAGADAVRAKVASLGGIVRRYAKGAAVLREGDRATAAGVLLEGRLLVCRTDWDGRRTRDKVLAYLAAQSVRAGARDFEIPLSRQGLADYLAVDRSALSAELGRLRREGVLDFRKNRFRLR